MEGKRGDVHVLTSHCLPPQDIEVTSSPDDSIGCLSFSPPTLPGNFLIAGSWANDVSVPQCVSCESGQGSLCFSGGGAGTVSSRKPMKLS